MGSKIKIFDRDTIQDSIQKLRDDGVKIWSISRLNNFNNCKRGYYYTYIDKKPQKDGIYSLLGSAMHSDFEDLYNGITDKLTPNHFNETWFQTELFGVEFPSELIKGNYKKDLDKLYETYKKMDGDFISELGFILMVDDQNALIGYIDLVKLLDGDEIEIYDFKSSAMFKDEKLVSAGRQLCLYQMAVEDLYGCSVVNNGWIMSKYSDLTIGEGKTMRAVQNKDLVKKSEVQLRKLMKKVKYDDMLIEMYITNCKNNNSFNELPSEIKEQIKIESHTKLYPITEDIKEETMEYITSTIQSILDTNPRDIDCWSCKAKKVGEEVDFFCKNLCGFYPNHCNGGV